MNGKLFLLIKMAYASILRPLVAEKIETSPNQIDDVVLGILDKIFDYTPGTK